jgi:hypothetical protein
MLWREMPLSGKLLPYGFTSIKALSSGVEVVRHAKWLKTYDPASLTGNDLIGL